VSGFVQDRARHRPFVAECNAGLSGPSRPPTVAMERRPAARGFRASGWWWGRRRQAGCI